MNSAPTQDSMPAILLPRSAYIHVPFCAHRCGYCDFTLVAGRDDLIGDYLAGLDREIENDRITGQPPLNTLFLGGGTPTHPPINQLRQLLQIILRRFSVSTATEFSVEANPLDLTDSKIQLLSDNGVNRISLGVQSFSRKALTLLERDHSPEDITDVLARLNRRFNNVSIDLIFGVPGQSVQDWKQDLQRAIDLGPVHISTYGLTYEQGTAFWTRRERGELQSIDEELEREQYAIAMDVLTRSGYEQYEISNFARPGFQCRHNHVYWNGNEYWAYGPGAARYLRGRRETNIRSVLGWLNRLEHGESPVSDAEELNPERKARELIYLGLRRMTGISRNDFQRRTGFLLDDLCGAEIVQQTRIGLLEDDGAAIRLTREGCFVADRVVMAFL